MFTSSSPRPLMTAAALGLLSTFFAASPVSAHGHVQQIIVDGVSYQGYLATEFPYRPNPPVVIGWSTDQKDNGFVAPSQFGSPDIICHRSAQPGGTHAQIAAGKRVLLVWNTWPESHHGPVMDFMARCPSEGCTGVDKTKLEFFKIDGVGLISGSNPGEWGSDALVKNNNSWLVQIPPNIAPGFYVLRHDIIALHTAGQQDGAQAYPQCINLEVTGGGSDSPAGVLGTALYKATDPGIIFNLYTQLSSYPMPGPEPIVGAVNLDQDSGVPITASVTPTAPGGSSPTSSPGGGNGNGNNGGGNNNNNNNNGGGGGNGNGGSGSGDGLGTRPGANPGDGLGNTASTCAVPFPIELRFIIFAAIAILVL